MVVATLIAGIAFQATLNPPGGYWQDDTKVDSGTDLVTFTYYLNHMYDSDISGNLESYMRTAIRRGNTQKAVTDFIEVLMNSSASSMTSKGLILEDFNKSNNSSRGFIPYLIHYAEYPILAYKNPVVYTIYMNTNIVAFFVSLITILLVLSGTVDDYQLRPLVALMCISTLCIGTSYVCILNAILPEFYATEPTIFSLYGFFALYCFYGIVVIIRIAISRKDKLRNSNLTGINYYTASVSMNASTAEKLMLLLFGYCVTLLIVFVSSKPPVHVNME